MKNTKLMFLKTAVVAVLGVATLSSCEKKETEVQAIDTLKTETVSKEVSIATLKEFMSSVTAIPADSIDYNKENQQFLWRGKNQISKSDLLLGYEQHIYAQQNKDKQWILR